MKKFFLLAFLIWLFPIQTLGSGIEVAPSKLNLNILEKDTSAILTISNPTADVQLFEVFPDDFESNIIIDPSSFLLESGAQKKVIVSWKIQDNEEKILKTNISVVAKPLADSKFQFNSGVKIPITISFAPLSTPSVRKQLPWPGYLLPIALTFFAIYYFYKKRRGLHHSSEQK